MIDQAEVVVVGSGHNALTAAAYLAKAGVGVLVLERNSWFGGGVVTREMTMPGFKHDTHSTGHIFIQSNPMLVNDELQLKSKYGLEYVFPEAVFGSIFEDGTTLQTFKDIERSCADIAKFSQRDPEAYRTFAEKAKKLMPIFVQGMFTPPAAFGTFIALLDQSNEGKELIGDLLKSPYEIVTSTYEHHKVRTHFLKWAAEAMTGPETGGAGVVLYLMAGAVHSHPTGLPVGGSGELTNALIRCIEAHGGRVEANCDVESAIVESGVARGVVLSDGRRITASRAVLACVHPHVLNDFLGGTLDEALQRNLRNVQLSPYSAVNCHYALKEAPIYKAGSDIGQTFSIELHRGSLQRFRETYDELRYGHLPKKLDVLAICNSNLDPTRAPDGQATLYLYNFAPYNLANGGADAWDRVKEDFADAMLEELREFTTNMSSDNIIQRTVESPLDFARSNPSMQQGDIMGASAVIGQFAGRRPTPEISNYTVPGLHQFYLVGPFMHPGGGVIGGGRPVAMKMMQDWKMNFNPVIAS